MKIARNYHGFAYCGIRTFSLKMHCGGKNWVKIYEESSDFYFKQI